MPNRLIEIFNKLKEIDKDIVKETFERIFELKEGMKVKVVRTTRTEELEELFEEKIIGEVGTIKRIVPWASEKKMRYQVEFCCSNRFVACFLKRGDIERV